VHKDRTTKRQTDKKDKKTKRQKDTDTETNRHKKIQKVNKKIDFSYSKTRGKTKLYCLAAMSELNIFLMVFIFPPELHGGKFILTCKKNRTDVETKKLQIVCTPFIILGQNISENNK
jgi:hypothetical protein